MRIGIVTGEYPPMQGGVGAYTAILARNLSAGGHNIEVFSTQNTRSEDIPLTNHLNDWGYKSLGAVAAWARANHLDILNLQYQTAAYGMSPWIHFLPDHVRRIPFITTFHDLRFPYLFPKAGPLRDWIVMRLASTSAGVIVTNHEDAIRMRHLLHHRLIPIGSNILPPLPDDYDPMVWRARAGATKSDFVLAYFGLINRSKGIEHLLESLAALRDEGLPVRLILVGGITGTSDTTNAAYAAAVDQTIIRLNLSHCIYRTGFLEDDQKVACYLKASDAVVLPFQDGASFRRGSLMAAIHYGCAIVTTLPRVHIPQFIHGENMIFVPPDDRSALQGALHQLFELPELLCRLQQGAARLAGYFDWQNISNQYIDFFQQVLGETA